MLVPSDYDSEDDSDYIPDFKEDEYSDDDIISDDEPVPKKKRKLNLTRQTSVSSTSNQTPTYRDSLQKAKADNEEEFYYTPRSGAHKNQVCKYVRKYVTNQDGQRVRTNQFVFKQVCV